MNSLIIPVYKNEESIDALIAAVGGLHAELDGELEVVFVVDGSPDRSHAMLRERLPGCGFASQLIRHSRNFGSFAAIRTGLAAASGDRFAVMAADLQEPPELVVEFFRQLGRGDVDVVVGTRDARADPLLSRLASSIFWSLYRRVVNRDIPPGGVDIFGCNRRFRDELLQLDESHSSLIGLLFWLGFRRRSVSYARRARAHGRSGWTFRRKLAYMADSIFSFSDLPIRLLLFAGILAMSFAIVFGLVVLGLRMAGAFAVPGYAATMATILFFGGLNALGLGIIGTYVWRAFANTQRRPLAVVMQSDAFNQAATARPAALLPGTMS